MTRGGKREHAGRKPGWRKPEELLRKKRQYYLTDYENEQVEKLIEKMREKE